MGVRGKYLKATLCLPLDLDGDKLSMLLAKKTRTIGVGRYNGPGGKLKPGETLRECLARESLKELGIVLDPQALKHAAVIDFYNRQEDNSVIRVRVWAYIAYGWGGNFRASDEMIEPALFPLSALPFNKMMPADPYWILPVLFGERKILGEFHYGPRQRSLEREPIILDLPEEMEDN